ncbi:MAG: hypothetical protein KatS3mg105_3994 [Gemmatales bacterium]|nr:MAG: hypothetical protein KatS3mg105_3994 [Gemmatales bacterium]
MPSVALAFLFTTPTSALAAAVAAASVPIIIHLLNRRRFRIVHWAAMRFLLAAQRKNTRKLRFEQLILLALRTLIVLLIVLAMASVMDWAEETLWARYFPGHATHATIAQQRTHRILVIDGSFSMALRQGGKTSFERACAAAREIVDAGKGGDGFSVVLMGSPPRTIVPEPAVDADKVIEEIESLVLPHGNADVAATFSTVEAMLARSPDKFDSRQVYFITDLQRATWTARLAVNPLSTLQKIQSKAQIVLLDVGRERVDNLAVTGVKLAAPLASTSAVTPFTATIRNYGAAPRRKVRVELLIGKAPASDREGKFALEPANQAEINVSPSETATVSFPYKFTTPGDYAVQVRISSDDLTLDDSRTVVVTVKETVPVMLVNGKPAVEIYERATEFLLDSLNPYQETPVPKNVPVRPKVLSTTQFADAGLGNLADYDCVFLCDVPRLSVAEVRRLETHLRNGGGVVFCLGPNVDTEAYNRLLFREGKGILPAKLIGRQRGSKDRAFHLFADEEHFKEPPLAAFADERDRATLTSARFHEYMRVEVPATSPAWTILKFSPETTADNIPVAEQLPHGDPAIIAWNPPIIRRGQDRSFPSRGRVVLLTSTVNMDWTSWPISPSFVPMMQELLRYAMSGKLGEQSNAVGDVLEAYLPLKDAGADAEIRLPDGKVETTRVRDQEENSLLAWAETQQSGIYQAKVLGDPQTRLFAVNVPTTYFDRHSSESDLQRTSPAELKAIYPGWDFQLVLDARDVVPASGDAVATRRELVRGFGTEIARLALLAVFVLLLVESVLAWVFGHYSGSPVDESARLQRDGWVYALGLLVFALASLGAFVLIHAAITGDFLGFLPERFRRGVEITLGIPPPAPGEGSRWRLEFSPYLTGGKNDPWYAGALALVALILLVAIYLREGDFARTTYKLLLAGMRFVLILLVLAVLLPQLKLWFERQSWPDVALMIDDSRSMSARDNYRDDAIHQAAERLAKQAGMDAPTRLELAKALLAHRQSDWLRTLLLEKQVKIHVYHCSGRAARLGDLTDPTNVEQQKALLGKIKNLQAEGDSSQLGTAVRQVLNDFRGSSLSAIIMLTDGVTTEGENLARAARYARQVGVPLFFVGIGDAHALRSLQLHDLRAEDSVFVGDRIVFEAKLLAQGYPERKFRVQLFLKGKEADGQELDAKTVSAGADGAPVKFRLVHRPHIPGETTYVIKVKLPPDEKPQPSDIVRLEHSVLVREAKLFKVLMIEDRARYEFRYVKNLLERESEAQKNNKTIDLRVLLLDADDNWASQDKSALVEFPDKVELEQFDVVILGDVDPNHPKLGPKNLSLLADFVSERGGGLLCIAGEHHNPHAFKETPLMDVLPLEINGPKPVEFARKTGFRPQWTPQGRFHPIFRFSPDEAENQRIWEELRELYWWSEGFRLKPAAEVLAEHPDVESDAAVRGDNAEGKKRPHPLIVQHFVGSGRCMFFGIHETWRWRWREQELRFNQFWIQTVRYLARSRLGRIELRLDRQTPYRRGEPIKVHVRFPDDRPPPDEKTKVHVFVERTLPGGGTEGQTLQLAKVPGTRATYEAILTRTPEGHYRFWLSAPTVEGPKPHAECRVLVPAWRNGSAAHEPKGDGTRCPGNPRRLLHTRRCRPVIGPSPFRNESGTQLPPNRLACCGIIS